MSQEKLTQFLKMCGYHPKKDIAYVPISGLYGDNIKNPVDHDKIWCASSAAAICACFQANILFWPTPDGPGLLGWSCSCAEFASPDSAITIEWQALHGRLEYKTGCSRPVTVGPRRL